MDDFLYGVGLADAEVVEEGGARLGELGEDGEVGAGEVVHMDIIAEAGAVWRGVVAAKDF